MTYTNSDDEKRSHGQSADGEFRFSVGSEVLPAEPNHHHPKHDLEGARRTFEGVRSGRRRPDDLTARQYGLLAYWYPCVVCPESEGGT